jgi:MFS superfamily sulfate permease-like transporter
VLLSDTLVSGFTTGAAVHVLTSQVKNLLGVKVQRYSGPLKVIYVSVVSFHMHEMLSFTCISVIGLCTVILPIFFHSLNCDSKHKFQLFRNKLKEIIMGLCL